MEITQSKLAEIKEYAEMFQHYTSRTGLIVDLTILIYTDSELQYLGEHHIRLIIEDILANL
jgi:hypothetical protein